MNDYLAICVEEMTLLSNKIKRLTKIVADRNEAKEYENALDAQKALNVIRIKLETVAGLVDKMCKCR